MATSISKNLSHRRLIKQKTNQLLDYHYCAPKTTKQLQLRAIDISNTLANQMSHKDHQTSINLDNSLDTSLSKRLHSKSGSQRILKLRKQPNTSIQIKNPITYLRRPNIVKFKSVQTLPKNQPSSINLRPSFSVKKLMKYEHTASQPKLASMENLETRQSPKKIEKEYLIPKSQTDLKQTLKKSSSSKLKLKVKDPFQKRTKLDIEFQDESIIGSKGDESLLSTVNQQQFLELLKKIK